MNELWKYKYFKVLICVITSYSIHYTKLYEVNVLPVETPPVLNNLGLSKKVKDFAADIIGSENIVETQPEMVGEDFGKYGLTPEDVPICLIWLGSSYNFV